MLFAEKEFLEIGNFWMKIHPGRNPVVAVVAETSKAGYLRLTFNQEDGSPEHLVWPPGKKAPYLWGDRIRFEEYETRRNEFFADAYGAAGFMSDLSPRQIVAAAVLEPQGMNRIEQHIFCSDGAVFIRWYSLGTGEAAKEFMVDAVPGTAAWRKQVTGAPDYVGHTWNHVKLGQGAPHCTVCDMSTIEWDGFSPCEEGVKRKKEEVIFDVQEDKPMPGHVWDDHGWCRYCNGSATDTGMTNVCNRNRKS